MTLLAQDPQLIVDDAFIAAERLSSYELAIRNLPALISHVEASAEWVRWHRGQWLWKSRFGRAAGQSYRSIGPNTPYLAHTTDTAPQTMFVPAQIQLEPSAAFALPIGANSRWSILYVVFVQATIATLIGRANNTPTKDDSVNIVHYPGTVGQTTIRSYGNPAYDGGYVSGTAFGEGYRTGLITYSPERGIKFARGIAGVLTNEPNVGLPFGPLTTGMYCIGTDPANPFPFIGQICAFTTCAADLRSPEYAGVLESAYQASRTKWTAV